MDEQEIMEEQEREIQPASIRRRATRKAAAFAYNSKEEPPSTTAKEVLRSRGLKTPHIVERVYELLLREAESQQIPANRFLFANGIVQALRSHESKAPLPLEPLVDEYIQGELLKRVELFALYDASIATHEQITFQEFLETRLRCKSDTYFLGKEVFKNDFAHCHEVWRDFFPQWNPLTLPPNYSQKQAIDWLASQSDIKDFLLMASRRAFKSSFARLWLISAIVTLPDIRVLVVSETRPLAKDNIEAVRGYFETTPGFQTRFQRLFPEFCIPVGDGSVMSLEVPLRRLKLPQSIESSSMDSTVAGRRADIILFDDPISEVSCTNEVQIQKSVLKRDMLVKLKERGGLVVTLGTPYAAQDLYSVMIERSEKNQDETFSYRVDPAFTVKPHALRKLTPTLLPTLEESDVEEFLFPEGLPWKELRTDMRNSPAFFMSQNLCILPLAEDEVYRCQFEHDELWNRVKSPSFFQSLGALGAQTWMSLDRAYSVSKYSDLSALIVGKIQPVENRMALVIHDVHMERLKESDLVKKILDMIETHRPQVFIAEKDKNWNDFWQSIIRGCTIRGIACPHFRWIDIDTSDKSFARRVKTMELPLSDGRLYFSSTIPQLEQLLQQLERFDGRKRSGNSVGSKDDGVASLSLMWSEARILHQSSEKAAETQEEFHLRKEQEEREERQEMNRANYQRIFGNESNVLPPPQVEQPRERPTDPRLRILGGRSWRM
jgi:hypothetical protein